jgi:hypothetical protein
MVTKYKATTKNILYVHFYEELTDGENPYKAIFRAMQTSSSSVKLKQSTSWQKYTFLSGFGQTLKSKIYIHD